MSPPAHRPRPAPPSAGRWLLFLLGLALGLPALVLAGLALLGPPSVETGLFVLALAIGVGGALAAPWRRTRPLVVGALSAVLLLVGYRYVVAGSGEQLLAMTGPGGGGARFIDRMVPERDVALGGVLLLKVAGAMPRDVPGLLPALRDGYGRMRLAEGDVPSAVVGTLLFGQSPEEHSLLRIGPPRRGPPEAAIVFLHGYMGSVTLICWQLAQAASPVGVDVLCPATDIEAEWAEDEGRAIVEQTLASLRAEGVRRVYLAGLSRGAIGASRLASRLDVDGVILVSGAAVGARPPNKPVLVVQGARDRLTRPGPARAYAERAARGRYAEHREAGHWLILSHHEWFTEQVRYWLAAQEGLGGVHETAP